MVQKSGDHQVRFVVEICMIYAGFKAPIQTVLVWEFFFYQQVYHPSKVLEVNIFAQKKFTLQNASWKNLEKFPIGWKKG